MEDGRDTGGKCGEEVGLRKIDPLRANKMKLRLGKKLEDSFKTKMVLKKFFFPEIQALKDEKWEKGTEDMGEEATFGKKTGFSR